MKKIFLFLLLILGLYCGDSAAEERTITYADQKIRFEADYVEFDQEKNILYGRGSFHLIQESAELFADEAEINLTTKEVFAQGHVMLKDKDVELYGDEIQYNMETKKGKVIQGVVYQRPWIIYGPSMDKISEKKTVARHARITSCDLSPPHYYLSTSKVLISMDEYLFALNTVMWVDTTPVFYMPAFIKSLGERFISFDIRPGYSKREGITIKSAIGIPIGSYMYSKLYIDYFELKGTGIGVELNYFKDDVFKGTLYSYTIKERDTLNERWNIRGAHWQRLSKTMYMQSNLNFQSDENFNNTYFKESYYRVIQTLKSDMAFTNQTKKTTTRVLFRRNDTYDALKGKFVADTMTAPSIFFTTSRIEIGRSRWYYTVNALLNHTYSKTDEFYRKSGSSSFLITRNIRFSRSTTFKPSITYEELWQDRRSHVDLRNLFNGKYKTNMSLRQRITRWVDLDNVHNYVVRTMPNTIKTNTAAVDKGIEQNSLSTLINARLGRIARLKLYSGYDFHKKKGEVIKTYKEKISDITSEIKFRLGRNISVSLRDIYDVYPRKNVGFSGSLSAWNLRNNWSYLKSSPGSLNMNHSLVRNITKKTHISFGIRYIASGPNKMNYDRIEFTERSLTVVRDLHCFELSVSYLRRGESEEILFNLQLKVDMQRKKKLFDMTNEQEFYPWRK